MNVDQREPFRSLLLNRKIDGKRFREAMSGLLNRVRVECDDRLEVAATILSLWRFKADEERRVTQAAMRGQAPVTQDSFDLTKRFLFAADPDGHLDLCIDSFGEEDLDRIHSMIADITYEEHLSPGLQRLKVKTAPVWGNLEEIRLIDEDATKRNVDELRKEWWRSGSGRAMPR